MSQRSLRVVRCADITPTAVSWLWEPYLARGKLAVLDGDPGTGKSFVTIDLAARITRGSAMPGGRPATRSGAVLLLNAEDDATDTIQPRVIAAGGDPDRVRVVAAPGLGLERLPQFPDDLPALEQAIREADAALVVIDPMMAFFPPTVSANNDQCIRTALTPLAALAAATDACVLLVRHLRKAGGPSAIYRGAGSIGIMGAVRTGLVIARHPDDPELRVLAMTKTNVGVPGPSLGFRLVQSSPLAPRADVSGVDGSEETTARGASGPHAATARGASGPHAATARGASGPHAATARGASGPHSGQTVVEWAGQLDLTADDLCGSGTPLRAGRHSRERAAQWLRQLLAEGSRRVAEIQQAADAAGIAWRTLERVKESLGFRSEAVHRDGRTEWWWHDPAVKSETKWVSILPPLDPFGGVGPLPTRRTR